MSQKKHDYTVLIDTGEQQPWYFDQSRKANLDTGDYTLEGYEDIFVIERKGRISEFAHNINEARFERELERLEAFRFPFIILEFSMEDIMIFPTGSGIPQEKWRNLRVNPWFILKRLLEFEMKYKTKIILAGDYGRDIARSLFNRVIEWKKKNV